MRIYCVFDDDAITGDDVNEGPLPRSATDGDWKMSIPCQPEDVAWSSSKLATVSDRVSARAPDDDVEDDATSSKTAPSMTINTSEFFKS